MIYAHFRPIPELAPFIDCFWIIKSSAIPGVTPKVRMPADSRPTMLLSFAGDSRFVADNGGMSRLSSGADLLGAHAESYILEHDGDTDLVAAQFRAGGLAPFVSCGIDELSGRATPVSLLWGGAGNRILERAGEAESVEGKLLAFQESLVERLSETSRKSDIERVTAALRIAGRSAPIDRLAEQVNLSQKQFERSFTRVVGMMPKRYFRLARFQRIARFLTRSRNGVAIDWAGMALKFGYYDQSHMTKDFQDFAGISPGKFSAATLGVVEVVYGDRAGFGKV